MKNTRDLWLEINGINIKEVKKEAKQTVRLRSIADKIANQERAVWKKRRIRTRNRKVL